MEVRLVRNAAHGSLSASGSKMTQQYQQGCINLVCEDDVGAARTVYVGKNGNDLNSGQSSLEPKLTIAAAMAEAASLLPTSTDRVVVQILDTGDYAEDVVGLENVILHGPQAKVLGGIAFPQEFYVTLREVEQSGAGTIALFRSGAPGTAIINLDVLICNDTSLGLVCIGLGNIIHCIYQGDSCRRRHCRRRRGCWRRSHPYRS